MSSALLYDTIGTTYTATRRTEPRIAAQIWAALGDARTVVNVGAGTGSYEPFDRQVLAVEPSSVMRSQRPPSAAPCLAATAEKLPFEDACFDAAMAIATVVHWQDPIAGLREMRRVARRVVVFTYDFSSLSRFWLTRDYVPEVLDLLAGRPSLSDQADAIGARIEPSRSSRRTRGDLSNYKIQPVEPAAHAIGRSRGGLTTKLASSDFLVLANCWPQ